MTSDHNNSSPSKSGMGAEIDKILDNLWSAAQVDTVNTINKTKPKNSTYVSDNFWEAKSALITLYKHKLERLRDGLPKDMIDDKWDSAIRNGYHMALSDITDQINNELEQMK